MGSFENLIGKKFHYLTVIDLYIDEKAEQKRYTRIWICRCKCGNIIKVKRPDSLKCGDIKSCGCYSKETIKKAAATRKLKKGQASFNALFFIYKKEASNRNLEFKLNENQFRTLTKNDCFYCGQEPSQIDCHGGNGNYIYNGVDRLDSSIGYTIENCVPCCKICNYMKRNLPEKEFFEHIKNIYNFQHHGIVVPTENEDFNDLIAFNILKREYIKNARNKDIKFKLTDKKFKQLTKSDCVYCGTPPRNIRENLPKRIYKYTFNGIDRLDSSKGYIIKNCVPCCKTCNYMKRHHSVEKFLNHIDKVFTKHRNLWF